MISHRLPCDGSKKSPSLLARGFFVMIKALFLNYGVQTRNDSMSERKSVDGHGVEVGDGEGCGVGDGLGPTGLKFVRA